MTLAPPDTEDQERPKQRANPQPGASKAGLTSDAQRWIVGDSIRIWRSWALWLMHSSAFQALTLLPLYGRLGARLARPQCADGHHVRRLQASILPFLPLLHASAWADHNLMHPSTPTALASPPRGPKGARAKPGRAPRLAWLRPSCPP
jgi:hypothetical protein